jgi:hypothetical protein
VQASLQAGISFSGVEIFTHLNGLTAGSTAGGAQFAASAAGTIVGIATVAVAIGACVEGFFDLMDASVTGVVDRVMGNGNNKLRGNSKGQPNNQRLIFQSKDPRIDSKDGDLNKDDLIKFDVGFRKEVVDVWHEDLTRWFQTGYKLSASGEKANDEALSLLNHFINGEQSPDKVGTEMGSEMFFDQESEIAKILAQDKAFIELKTEFEKWANYHFQNGSMDLKSGEEYLRLILERKGTYFDDTYFMHTIMGGTSGVEVYMDIIDSKLSFTYRIYDHFGGGTHDYGSDLPGLPSLYMLQHRSDLSPRFASMYRPFVWSVMIH